MRSKWCSMQGCNPTICTLTSSALRIGQVRLDHDCDASVSRRSACLFEVWLPQIRNSSDVSCNTHSMLTNKDVETKNSERWAWLCRSPDQGSWVYDGYNLRFIRSFASQLPVLLVVCGNELQSEVSSSSIFSESQRVAPPLLFPDSGKRRSLRHAYGRKTDEAPYQDAKRPLSYLAHSPRTLREL